MGKALLGELSCPCDSFCFMYLYFKFDIICFSSEDEVPSEEEEERRRQEEKMAKARRIMG